MIANAATSKSIIESLSSGVVLLNKDSRILYVNPAAEALLSISGERAYGLEFNQILQGDEITLEDFRKAAEALQAFTQRETCVRLHNDKVITLDYSVSPMLNPENNDVIILVELSEREHFARISRDKQLLAKHETTQSLVRGLAHEVKNPLGGIRGAAQLLEAELPTAEMREYTGIIIEEADRLRDLVDRLLGPRKIPQQQNINIHEITERVLQLIQVESNNTITLTRDYDPSIPDFNADKDQLIQATLNICRNAMQAMVEDTMASEPAKLTVQTRTVRQFTIGQKRYKLAIQVNIIDNGPGIAPDLLDKLFYPMVSGRPTGTGLGLSLSQSIINQHHGIIEFDSQPRRTIFSIYLPLENL